jgi:hypothetical protein
VVINVVRILFWSTVMSVALSGCNPNKPQRAENHEASAMKASSAKHAGATVAPPELVLAAFKIVDAHNRVMEVAADGVATLPLGVWGRVSSDGVVVDGKGAVRARLSGERVVDAAGAVFAHLSADSTATVDGREFRFDAEGRFVIGPEYVILLSPADSPARRTATLILLTVLLRPAAGDIKLTPSMQFNVPITEDKPK